MPQPGSQLARGLAQAPVSSKKSSSSREWRGQHVNLLSSNFQTSCRPLCERGACAALFLRVGICVFASSG